MAVVLFVNIASIHEVYTVISNPFGSDFAGLFFAGIRRDFVGNEEKQRFTVSPAF